jgi:hypothetical protein
MSNETIAGLLANLYGDPSDPTFSAQEPWIATTQQLEEAHLDAVCTGAEDAATAYAVEIRRSRREGPQETALGVLIGNQSGLCRVH